MTGKNGIGGVGGELPFTACMYWAVLSWRESGVRRNEGFGEGATVAILDGDPGNGGPLRFDGQTFSMVVLGANFEFVAKNDKIMTN